MQFEMTNSICALCKSAFAPTADAYPGPSRLCNQCQQLVQTILPRNGSAATAEAAAVFDTAAAKDNRAIENGFDYREEIGAGEPSFFRPEEESYYKTDLEIQPDSEEFDDFVEDFPGAPRENVVYESADDLSNRGSINFSPSDSLHDEDAVSPAAEETASSYDAPEAWQNATQVYGAQTASEYIPATTSPLADETFQEQARDDLWPRDVETVTSAAQTPSPKASDYDEAATDPWEKPLPAWDYSHTEYPVLLSPKRPRKRKKLWLPIAAGLLIILLIAGYIVLSQPGEPRPGDANAQPSLAEPGGDSAASNAQAPPTPAATEQQSTPAPASADTNLTTYSAEFGGAGTLTLQSAAFPDEAGANEFSEKLIRAGIPAYVVPVDLARKGRWFRVRVGRFTNGDGAKKYAVQSRLRAKAAGMDVDFIVVEYGKP